MTEEFIAEGLSYDLESFPSEMIIRHRFKPIKRYSTQKDTLARNSFPSVNETKYLENAMLRSGKK
ncbi:DUF2737 family protein [Salmonella enterica subsp. enterica]|nr:DUF2737 family protein [Salmonella enterica subsp. enterica]